MARRLRIEYPGAVYHVLNRGKSCRGLFRDSTEAQVFVTTVEEAVSIYQWRLHAFAVMPGHYHLALETPEPNLVAGMHWLQGTFAGRLNHLRGESGPIFQGRYRALLIEGETALVPLVDFIHLNPVRAGILRTEHVGAFRWGSLNRFIHGNPFPGLESVRWMKALGLTEDRTGWADYLERLKSLSDNPDAQERDGFARMSTGWAIGPAIWRRRISREYAETVAGSADSATESRRQKERVWARERDRLLEQEGRTVSDAKGARKGAAWKVEIASRLRLNTGAPVRWIAESLFMGNPDAVRSLLYKYRAEQGPADRLSAG
ncbi:MAG: transposase [Opitutaceae bacterium]